MNKLLNLNIFYDPNYWLKDRKVVVNDFSQSSLLNYYYVYNYKRNKPIKDKYIKSGPQKLVNNILRIFKDDKSVVFNTPEYNKFYFCSFDRFNESMISDTLKKNTNQIIVGPLYTNKNFMQLCELANRNNNLKIVTASSSSKEMLLKVAKGSIDLNKIVTLPVGVAPKQQIKQDSNKARRDSRCLIYYKGRNVDELDIITKALKKRNVKFQVFEYGKYKNSNLLKSALDSKFGIILGRTESQGIAINELMATNLPLLVLDSTINHFEGDVFEGTSIPYWDKSCGEVISQMSELEKKLDILIKNIELDKYTSNTFIKENLSYEAMSSNLEGIFSDF